MWPVKLRLSSYSGSSLLAPGSKAQREINFYDQYLLRKYSLIELE